MLLVFSLISALSSAGMRAAATWGFKPVGRGLNLDDWGLAALTWPTLLSTLLATAICMKLFKEPVGLRHPRSFWLGAAAGAGALALCVVVPTMLGHGTLGPPSWPVGVIALTGVMQLLTVAPTSVGEEFLFRGLPFQALGRSTHPLFAVVTTSLLFGLAHLKNPNASIVASINVALVGVWFGLVAWRYSLWASIGLHVTWNWFEGFVFGQPVSGLQPGPAMLTATWPLERSFWAGGAFGPEASGWTSVVLLFGIAAVAVAARRELIDHPRSEAGAPVGKNPS